MLLVNVGSFCVRSRHVVLAFLHIWWHKISNFINRDGANSTLFFHNVESWWHSLSLFWSLLLIRSDYVMLSPKVMIWHSREHEKVRISLPFGKEAAWYQPANMISSCLFHSTLRCLLNNWPRAVWWVNPGGQEEVEWGWIYLEQSLKTKNPKA